MKNLYLIVFSLIFIIFKGNLKAQLTVTSLNTAYVINFDETLDGVNNGQFKGTGFALDPADGQLDADAWAIFGFSDGDKDFGVESTALDFTRGISNGEVTTGGIYAFQVEDGNFALGVQPTTDDFTPGWIGLKIVNTTGSNVEFIEISYDIWVYNDQPRQNSFNLEVSLDGINWSPVLGMEYLTPSEADPIYSWSKQTKYYQGQLLSGFKSNTIYLRWYSDDVSGSGARDEIALDNISIRLYKSVINSFPFIETFEDDSPTRGEWTQIYVIGNKDWTFDIGAGGGNITNAYEGNLNARFTSSFGGPYITKLVSPILNTNLLNNPELVFWYGQEEWLGDQNELKIYYRNLDLGEDWIQIAHFTENVPIWTKARFDIPRANNLQLAFEGIDNYGRANVLDYVVVREKPTEAPDWCNLSSPGNLTVDDDNNNITVSAKVIKYGVTDGVGQGEGIEAWIGYSTTDTDPATWTNWVPATYVADDGNADEYSATIGPLPPGTYYIASRFSYLEGPYVYGGYNEFTSGGFWDGTENVSGIVNVIPIIGRHCLNPFIVNIPNDLYYSVGSSTCSYKDYYNSPETHYDDGEDVIYQLNVTDSVSIKITMEPQVTYTSLYLFDNCPFEGNLLSKVENSSPNPRVIQMPLTPGTYYLMLDIWPAPICYPYVLRIENVCLPPTNIQAFNVTTTTANITWEPGAFENAWYLKVSSIPIDPISETGDIYDNVVTEIPVGLSGLSPQTTYYVYLKTHQPCESEWVSFSFETECDAFNLPLTENFEGGSNIPMCWEVKDIDGTGNRWEISIVYNHTPEGQYSARHYYHSTNTEDGWLISPRLILPENERIFLKFWSYNSFPSDYIENSVWVSTNTKEINDFVKIWQPSSVTSEWVETELDLSEYAGDTIYIAFRYYGYNAHVWYLDDIEVKSYPVISQIDVNNEVQDISVCKGTELIDVLSLLPTHIIISDSRDSLYSVALEWNIVNYDPNTPGTYIAIGTFNLPDGVYQTIPPTPLEVTSNINVLEPVVPEFTLKTNYCVGETPETLPLVSNNGIIGTWTPSEINTNEVGTFQYHFTPDAGQCATELVVDITVSDEIIPIFDIPSTYCVGQETEPLPTTSLNGVTGYWDPSIVNTSIAGTYTHVFTPTDPYCATTYELIVTVNENVVPEFNIPTVYCVGETAPELPQESLNGIIGEWSPSEISTDVAGVYTYTFTPAAGQCATTYELVVTVNENVVPVFNIPTVYCVGETAPELPQESLNGIIGEWSPSEISTDVAGVYTYTFTPAAGQCATTYELIVTVNENVVPVFNIPTVYCVGETAPVLPQESLNGINGTWTPSAINTDMPGTFQFTFTPNEDECAEIIQIIITIHDLPIVTCPNDTFTNGDPIILTGATPEGGIYSGPGVEDNTFIPQLAGEGTHTIMYTYVDSITGCANYCTFNITYLLNLKETLANKIYISPNPNKGIFYAFFSANKQNIKYELYDIKGTIIDEGLIITHNNVHEFKYNLPVGVYYIKFVYDNITTIEKIVITK